VSALRHLATIGLVEGWSYLILLGVAMPLKYFAGFPAAVRVVGMAHGVLFVLFCAALLRVMIVRRWSILRGAAAFGSSLVPFGTFVLDRVIKKEIAEATQAK
jgi:integral membrane protein